MPNLSKLKKQIESTNNINDITNAMHLVASAKLNKMGKKILETQQYVSEVYTVFNDIIKQTEGSIYLKNNSSEIKKTLWVVINSNLGLCGGYNSNINKLVMANIKPTDSVYSIGNKAIAFYKNRKVNITKMCNDIDVNFSNTDARALGNDLLSYYLSKEFDEVKIVYSKFINNVTFTPTILRVFPIIKDPNAQATMTGFSFEPSPKEILDTAVNIYLNAVIYGTIIESQVSEQASRRMAMENATTNGEEMINKLKIQFNRERQAAITQELSEIISGANAQEN